MGETVLQVYRGESSGVDFTTFDIRKTRAGVGFFFTTCQALAASYGHGNFRTFTLRANNPLDLREIDWLCPQTRAVLKELGENWDEWTDRFSGEPTDPGSLIEAGALYHYEGTGSGRRWHDLFRTAHNHGFDLVRVLDASDRIEDNEGDPEIIVAFRNEQIQIVE